MSAAGVPRIDWQSWQPRDVATLMFIVQNGRVLLIRTKRGLGAGKVNGPGGRLEPGESPLAAAIREVEEEVCVTPSEIQARGELSFDFTDGYRLHAHVFVAFAYQGTPRETAEADPFWCELDALPFSRMWADDVHWLPHVLAGRSVRGRFQFDGERMLDYELEVFDLTPLPH